LGASRRRAGRCGPVLHARWRPRTVRTLSDLRPHTGRVRDHDDHASVSNRCGSLFKLWAAYSALQGNAGVVLRQVLLARHACVGRGKLSIMFYASERSGHLTSCRPKRPRADDFEPTTST
jgi:hypothetical protein